MFCPECGKTHAPSERCSKVVRMTPEESRALIRLPKASTPRRLLGSGIEFFTYQMAAYVLLALSTVFLDILVTIPLFLMIALRDTHGGRFSLEKRLGGMRVVKHGTGLPIDNRDALKRNSYYLALIGLTVVPFLPIDAFSSGLFNFVILVDVLMITLRQDGRRLGDLLAGTQVVRVKPEETVARAAA